MFHGLRFGMSQILYSASLPVSCLLWSASVPEFSLGVRCADALLLGALEHLVKPASRESELLSPSAHPPCLVNSH